MRFKEVRDLFFETYPQFKSERKSRKKQNDFSVDCRCCFVDFIDGLSRDNQITDKQRQNITLIG